MTNPEPCTIEINVDADHEAAVQTDCPVFDFVHREILINEAEHDRWERDGQGYAL